MEKTCIQKLKYITPKTKIKVIESTNLLDSTTVEIKNDPEHGIQPGQEDAKEAPSFRIWDE